jgi:hypothetical protein
MTPRELLMTPNLRDDVLQVELRSGAVPQVKNKKRIAVP